MNVEKDIGNKAMVASGGYGPESPCDVRAFASTVASEVSRHVSRLCEAEAEENEELCAKKGEKGFSSKAMDRFVYLMKIADECEQKRTLILDRVRLFRMALTSEVAQIEKAVKALQAANIGTVAADMDRLAKAMESDGVKMLIRYTAGGATPSPLSPRLRSQDAEAANIPRDGGGGACGVAAGDLTE